MTAPTDVSIALTAQAQSESAAFLKHFDALIDPRQPGKVVYPLDALPIPRAPSIRA